MSVIVTIFWYLVMSYIDSQKNKSYVLYDAILFCSGAMELAVPDHQEQIGGIGHTKEFGLENMHIAS